MSKQRSYNTFRQMFPEFVYESFHYDVQSDGLHIAFSFRLNDKLVFRPEAFIPRRPFLHPEQLPHAVLDTLVFHIGMIELVSYWKSYCPPTVVVKPYRLDDAQIEFWKKLFFNGLGEFFYTNGIRATQEDFMTIRCADDAATLPTVSDGVLADVGATERHIVPIGGGKDSVVTLEVLGGGKDTADVEAARRPLPLIMNPRGATVDCVGRAGYSLDDVIVVRRTIHPLLLDLNKQGALNGHTPFSAMLAFYTLLASALTGTRPDVALSNESSANESTVAGTNVNHQYSKSLEFENDFRQYVARYLSPRFSYYSFLRPLSELQIAMLFAQHGHYFDVFKSCNVGSKEDVWCGHCAKCLFAYIILSPFIEPDKLNAVFGKNMLDDASLRHEFMQLTGHAETKPFECVGTVSEVNSALAMTIAKWYGEERPALLKDYTAMPAATPLHTFFAEHNVPSDDLGRLRASVDCCGAVEHLYRYCELFNLLSGKEILIAGYGREGQSSHRLLQRLFPHRVYDIASNNEEIVEALQRKRYDLILKSPGIPTFVFEGHCDLAAITSQTDIFLQVFGDQTVGVTGTKGKSTTTKLLFDTLQVSGHQVIMAGNMGIPLFDILKRMGPEVTAVAEFSCHQLENIHRGPHIAVLLNLFQEHLDHYHSYRDYQMAKMQIGLRQQEGDMFYYCSDNEELRSLVEECRPQFRSRMLPYSLADARGEAFLDDSPLPGDHNRSNCHVVWQVVQQFGVGQQQFAAVLSSFHGLEHRMERVASVNGVTYYNDSISTIPQTAIAAVEALKGVETMILGGFNRGIDYGPLALFLTESPLGQAVRCMVLLGSAGEEMERCLVAVDGLGGREVMRHFAADYSMEEAVHFAAAHTRAGAICLLSPAASSYDRFKNFEERGACFKEYVKALIR